MTGVVIDMWVFVVGCHLIEVVSSLDKVESAWLAMTWNFYF